MSIIKRVMPTNIKLIFIFLLYFITFGKSKICYWNSECFYKYFSSKTSYDFVRGDIRDSVVKLKGCEPISIWTLIRHGRRNPGVDYGRNMMEAIIIRDYIETSYKNGNSSLCAQDVENLLNWKDDRGLFKNKHGLTDEGYREIQGIGSRLKEAYRNLLTDLKDGTYTLRSTAAQWVEDGVDGFVKGVSKNPLFVESTKPEYDIMAPYEACPRYMESVRHNPVTFRESKKYQTTPEFIATRERIQKRTGIQYVLTDTNITSLYDLCRYTWSAINDKPSPWCALFSKEDLQVLNYYGDLRHYYRNGYGTAMNEKFGRIPMADMYKTFLNVKNGSKKKLTAYFSHATMMDMVYSALGWYRDKNPLKGNNRDPNRKWKASKLSPFAANLIAVLYRCSTHDNQDYKIVFYNNEKRMTSICGDGIWSWEKFERKFKNFLNTSLDFCYTDRLHGRL